MANTKPHTNIVDETVDVVADGNKLTKWENEPTARQLQQNLKDARSAHTSHVNDVKLWLDNLNITGKAKQVSQTNRSTIVPKLIRKQAEWRYASLSEPFLSTPDIFNTAPETYEDKPAAEQAGLILNHQFNTKIRKVNFIDEYVRTAVNEGSVIIRLGWEFEEAEVEVDVPDMQRVPVADPIKAEQMRMQGVEPVEEIQVGTHKEMQMKVIKNHPTAEVCHFENVIVDPTAEGNPDKVNFVIFSLPTNLSTLEKDGRYSNLDKISTTDGSILRDPDYVSLDETKFEFEDKPRKQFIAYEYWGYWDIHATGIVEPIVATWVNDVLIRMEEIPFPDKKLPFVFVQYLPVKKSLYGEPDGSLLEDNQKIIAAVTRGMIDIMGRSANGQMGIQKGALDVTNKRKFEKGEDYEFNPNYTAANAFHTHIFPPIPTSAEFLLSQQNNEAESLSGVKAFSNTGLSGQALGNTATAVRSAMDATSKRELGILRRLAEGIKEIGRKIMAMNIEFLSEEETIRITNEDFITIRKDNLIGNYDIALSISTAETDNEKAKELAFMLQTMGNNMDASMSQMILADIAKLRNMPELAKRIEEYKPQPDPLEQRKRELEVGKLEAEIMDLRAKAEENMIDKGLKLAKTKTEEAKARRLHSESDTADLDFLEQDSGLKDDKDENAKQQDHLRKLDEKAADKLLQAEDSLNKAPPQQGATSSPN